MGASKEMSSILFSNPFAPASPAPSPTTDASGGLAVAPPSALGKSTQSGDATAFSGSGNGRNASNQSANVAFLRAGASDNWDRPADATGRSIIGAQAQENSSPFGVNLPEVEMPLPLPTSPILKRGDD